MRTAAGLPAELLPLAVFLLLAALFAIFGAYLLRRPERAAALFADREARHTFRAKDARAIGLVFTIGGLGLLALGAVRLVLTLAAG